MTARYRHTPGFELENMKRLNDIWDEKAPSRIALNRMAGLKGHTIYCYTYWGMIPDAENYNRLAEIFGWRKRALPDEIPEYVSGHIANLKHDRARMCLTQRRLARLCGVRIGTINRHENGRIHPTQYVYNKLAEVFGWEKWE